VSSGAILGTCPICNKLISEDDWDIYGDNMIHSECKSKTVSKTMRISQEHYSKLYEIKKVEKELNSIKKDLISNFEYYKLQIAELEETLEKLKTSCPVIPNN